MRLTHEPHREVGIRYHKCCGQKVKKNGTVVKKNGTARKIGYGSPGQCFSCAYVSLPLPNVPQEKIRGRLRNLNGRWLDFPELPCFGVVTILGEQPWGCDHFCDHFLPAAQPADVHCFQRKRSVFSVFLKGK